MAWGGGTRPAALSSARAGRALDLGGCWDRDLWLRSTLASEQFRRVVPFGVLSGLCADSQAEAWTVLPTHTHQGHCDCDPSAHTRARSHLAAQTWFRLIYYKDF